MNTIILILAREGSVRLKNKNLKLINKKSLVARTVEFAKKIAPISKIILSTDSKKIQKIGVKLGLNIPNRRPKKLAKNNSSSYEAAIFEINEYEKCNRKIDIIILLQPTSPFRTIKTYNKIMKKFLKEKKIPLVTVKKINLTSDKFFQIKKTKLCKIDTLKENQDIYVPNGSYHVITKNKLIKEKSFYAKKMNFFLVKDIKENIDIDTNEDLELAKNLIK